MVSLDVSTPQVVARQTPLVCDNMLRVNRHLHCCSVRYRYLERFHDDAGLSLERSMTSKQFFDWQTSGGTDDVMRMVDCLERADVLWYAIGGVAVNHWAAEPVVTQDVDFVVVADSVAWVIPAVVED
jgi:hypothetical protein